MTKQIFRKNLTKIDFNLHNFSTLTNVTTKDNIMNGRNVTRYVHNRSNKLSACRVILFDYEEASALKRARRSSVGNANSPLLFALLSPSTFPSVIRIFATKHSNSPRRSDLRAWPTQCKSFSDAFMRISSTVVSFYMEYSFYLLFFCNYVNE